MSENSHQPKKNFQNLALQIGIVPQNVVQGAAGPLRQAGLRLISPDFCPSVFIDNVCDVDESTVAYQAVWLTDSLGKDAERPDAPHVRLRNGWQWWGF